MHPIIESIENDNYPQFVQLLNEHPEYINEVDKDGWGLLSLVTQYEMADFAEILLDKMDYEQINNQHPKHPLHISFENKTNDLTDLLIKHEKINLNQLSKSGDNFLYYADLFNREDLSQFLLDSGLSPFTDNNVGQSALLFSIENGNTQLFDLYTQNPDYSSYYNDDWIKKAIKHNQIDIFTRLHAYSDLSSDELFNLAVGFEHVQIVNLVLDSGDLIPGQSQITHIIELMCRKYENEADTEASLNLADFLFDINIPFNKFINAEGQSAWMLSVYNDNEAIFEKLCQTNESVNIADDRQYTPLFYAIEKRNFNFVSSILKKKPNLNHVDLNKSTPLIQAVRYGLLNVVNEILKYDNVLVNEINNNNETALSIAVKTKRPDILTSLIWAGAEITTNPVKFIEDTSVFQIGLSGSYEKAYENIDEKIIDNFMALSKIGLRLDQVNSKGDNFLLHFIKNGYLANFKAILKCMFNGNQTDNDGNSPLMCAMKKNSDEYALGLLWKFSNLDYSITNKYGETVYDIAAECNSPDRVLELIKKDDNLTIDNLLKVIPTIILSGKIEKLYDILKPLDLTSELESKIGTLVDSYGNNMLMLAVMGNNFDNFKFLLEKESIHFNYSVINKNEENIVAVIRKLSEEDGILFAQTIKPYITKQKKKINK